MGKISYMKGNGTSKIRCKCCSCQKEFPYGKADIAIQYYMNDEEDWDSWDEPCCPYCHSTDFDMYMKETIE